jgi:hypothetical protein
MTILWFSITANIPIGTDNLIENYYFSVDTDTSLITGFYNYNNIGVDILAPNVLPSPFGPPIELPADNLFNVSTLSFTYNGVNITDPSLENTLHNNSPYYAFYNIFFNTPPTNSMWSYTSANNETTNASYDLTTNIIIIEISGPPTPEPTPTPDSKPDPIPISNVCFPASTPILTDQGIIPIEKIQPDFHTINNNTIVGITRTVTQDEYLVCFLKNALSSNIPSKKTIMSPDHKIWYNDNWVKAKKFINNFDGVTKIKYNGEILYNILLETHEQVIVNNLICETLHPENIVAKLYKSNLDEPYKNSLIIMMNDSILNEDSTTYKRIINIIDEAELDTNNEETNIILNFPNSEYANYNYNLNCKITNNVKIQKKLQSYTKTINNIKSEPEYVKTKSIFHPEYNLALQNKLTKYWKNNQNTEDKKNEIIQKKIYLNKFKEEKELSENKGILKKHLKEELKKINNSKTFKYRVKKNLTYKYVTK